MSGSLQHRAQDAMQAGNFSMAQKFYAELRQQLHGQQHLDATLNFAFCAERTGDYSEAVAAYRAIVDAYQAIDYPEGTEGDSPAILPHVQVQTAESSATAEPSTSTQAMDADEVIARLYLVGVHRKISAGEILCSYGDMPSHMWLLMRGSLLIQVDGSGEKEALHAIPNGTCFVGEIGFYTGRRRSATVSARSDVELIELDISHMHQLEREEPDFALGLDRLFRERLLARILSSHIVFSRMNEVARRQVALAFNALYRDAGSVICHEGEEQDGMYLIKTGCLFLLGKDVEEKWKLLKSATAGDIVLLGGLIRGYRSRCRIVAATPVVLLHLSREQLEPFHKGRPWLLQALLKHAREHENEQVMHPNEDYLSTINRYVEMAQGISLRPVRC